LLELSQCRVVQSRVKLRLTGQDQRQQLLGRRFHVCQEPQFLEQLDAQTLGFVNDKGGNRTGRTLLAEQRFELVEEEGLGFRRLRLETKSHRQQPDEVLRRQGRVAQVNRLDVPAWFRLERRTYERGFPRPGFANEHRNGFGRREPVLQVAERLAVTRRQKEEPGIRR
jgi:hypothetical protein